MLILVGVSISVLVNSDLIGTAQSAANRMETAYGEEGSMGMITVGNKTYGNIQDYLDGNVMPEWVTIYEGEDPTVEGQLMIAETEVFKNYYRYRITLDESISEEPIECIAVKFNESVTDGMSAYMLFFIADGEVITVKNTEDVEKMNNELGNYTSIIMVAGINITGAGSMIMAEASDGSQITITKIEEDITGPKSSTGFATNFGTIEIIWLDKNNNVINAPLAPVVNETYMTPVVWSDSQSKFIAAEEDEEWYNYIAGTGIADNTESKWANVEVKPTAESTASYFVWIPRYAYRITYYNGLNLNSEETEISGYCDGRGIVDKNGKVKYALDAGIETVKHNGNSYIVHPAFMDDQSSGYSHGGWTEDLAGIWVSKYEMSGTSTALTSIPNTASLVSVNIANMFNYSKDYSSNLKSHLMKNSEWGAVAYLTHSQYGRNGTEITINDIGTTTAGGDYITNKLQSSTGNVYGIYDLNGTCWEYVAAYNNSYDREGDFFGGTTGNTETYYKPSTGSHFAYDLNGASNEYVTAYTNDTEIYNGVKIYEVGKIGDATKEVYAGSMASSNWHGDYSVFVHSVSPFFVRGGYYYSESHAGVFYSGSSTGNGYDISSFRVVCAL